MTDRNLAGVCVRVSVCLSEWVWGTTNEVWAGGQGSAGEHELVFAYFLSECVYEWVYVREIVCVSEWVHVRVIVWICVWERECVWVCL